ncbi:hypothetical protein [Sphingomonas oryzagri]
MRDWNWRDRRMQWLGGLLGAAIVVGLIAAWASRGEFKGRYAVPALDAGHDGTVAQRQAAPSVIAPPATPPVIASRPPDVRPIDPQPQFADKDRAPPRSDDEDEPSDADRMARAIDRAARKALDRGEPVRWHKAGERGYVVVSDERYYGDRSCRNVSATINSDDGPTQSSSHLWCTTPDGDWEPAE